MFRACLASYTSRMRIAGLFRENPLIGWGCTSLIVSSLFCGLLVLTSSLEQAGSPGEKDFGVAVIGMAFGIPTLLFGVVGIVLLVPGIGVWAHRTYIRNAATPKRPPPNQ